MAEYAMLPQRARVLFDGLFRLEAKVSGIAQDEAGGEALRLTRLLDELRPYSGIFQQQPGNQAEIGPLLEVLGSAVRDLYGREYLPEKPEADEWQRAFFYLKELSARINALCGEVSPPAAAVTEASAEPAPPGDGAAGVGAEGPPAEAESEAADETEVIDAPADPPPALKPEPVSETRAAEAREPEARPAEIGDLAPPVSAEAPRPEITEVWSSWLRSDLRPPADGPTVYFLIQKLADSDHEQKMFSIIKMLLDKAESLMGETGRHFYYPLDLNFDKSFSVIAAAGGRELTETTGLAVTLEDRRIVLRGKPSAGYDGPLYFSFALTDRLEGVQTHQKPLYIAADPRTLWQDLPVEDDEGYPAANEASEARPLPAIGKVVVAASCRGRSHAHAAKPRDDSFLIISDNESGWNLVAAADGAGSARYSRKGSALACETVLGTLKQVLESPRLTDFFQTNEQLLAEWKVEFEAAEAQPGPALEKDFLDRLAAAGGFRLNDVMYRAVYEGYTAIEREARARKAQIRDYHSTLLCAAFKKFPFGYFIMSYWIGDGAMAVYNWNRRNRVLVPGAPDGGEFAGQTVFLTMGREEINPEAVGRRTRYLFAEDFEALILATDGVTDPFFPSEKSVTEEANWRDFWTRVLPVGDADAPPCPELFDEESPLPDQARALGNWLNFWSRGNHDDRTILIVK